MARKHPASTVPKLRVVPAQTRAPGLPPPGDLGPDGAAFWRAVMEGYEFSDCGSVETLRQACMALDLASHCRAQIEQDGLMLRSRTGLRDNPLIKHELAARSLAIRTLARLGLDLEAVRSGPGRPPGIGS
jgi:hypothetical protein